MRAEDPRIITVGSVTGNDNTVGGGGVYPIADLKVTDKQNAFRHSARARTHTHPILLSRSLRASKQASVILSQCLMATAS